MRASKTKGENTKKTVNAPQPVIEFIWHLLDIYCNCSRHNHYFGPDINLSADGLNNLTKYVAMK
jgi:hypothetical protein